MSAVILGTFRFPGSDSDVRITGTAEAPRSIVPDAARALGYDKSEKLLRHLDDDELDCVEDGVPVQDLTGRVQNTKTISFEGLNLILMRLRSERVKPFQHWLAFEVLPSIRKTGAYTAPNVPRPIQAEEPTILLTQSALDALVKSIVTATGTEIIRVSQALREPLPSTVETRAEALPAEPAKPRKGRLRRQGTSQQLGAVLASRGQRRFFTNRLLRQAKLTGEITVEKLLGGTYAVRATRNGRVIIDGLLAQAAHHAPRAWKNTEAEQAN